jgi:hypothetical protein
MSCLDTYPARDQIENKIEEIHGSVRASARSGHDEAIGACQVGEDSDGDRGTRAEIHVTRCLNCSAGVRIAMGTAQLCTSNQRLMKSKKLTAVIKAGLIEELELKPGLKSNSDDERRVVRHIRFEHALESAHLVRVFPAGENALDPAIGHEHSIILHRSRELVLRAERVLADLAHQKHLQIRESEQHNKQQQLASKKSTPPE